MRSFIVALASLLLVGAAASAHAAVMSSSTATPVVNGADIAQLVGTTNSGGNSGHSWSNRPVHGQTFTTGPNLDGYLLYDVSLKVRVDQGSTTSPNWNIRVGTVDGNPNFNVVASETATGVTIPQAFPGGSSPPPPQWVNWALSTPITLSPNTLYAFDVDPSGNGFIGLSNAGNVYAGGTAFSSGGGGVPANPITQHSFDRAFHTNLWAIPEPTTCLIWSLLAGLGVGLGWRRRK